MAAGERRVDIRDMLACNDGFITRWTRAYAEQGLPGLVSFYLAAELGDISRHMISNNPDFEGKVADVIGLYLNPPEHAAVFCVDGKTASV